MPAPPVLPSSALLRLHLMFGLATAAGTLALEPTGSRLSASALAPGAFRSGKGLARHSGASCDSLRRRVAHRIRCLQAATGKETALEPAAKMPVAETPLTGEAMRAKPAHDCDLRSHQFCKARATGQPALAIGH